MAKTKQDQIDELQKKVKSLQGQLRNANRKVEAAEQRLAEAKAARLTVSEASPGY